jgi:HEAT repeat protein
MPGPGGGNGGTRTPGRSSTKGPSFDSWFFWWNYNKDEILNLKARLRRGASASGGGSGILFGGSGSNEAELQSLTAMAIEQEIVPMLKTYARDASVDSDIQSAALLALAKFGRREEVPFLMTVVRNSSTPKYHKIVEESGALALGILQDRSPEVRAFLRNVALDGTAKTRTRSFAVISLGLLGETTGVHGANAESLETMKSLVTVKEAGDDVANSALVAMGLLGDAAAIPTLIQWLDEEKAGNRKLQDVTLSCVAAALGRIGQPGVASPESGEVVAALRRALMRRNRITRYSAAIALGQIAPRAADSIQKECVAMLSETVRSEGKTSDSQTVNFSLIALGRIAGVIPSEVGGRGCPEDVRTKALATLTHAFGSKNASTVSFAALGLALAARDLDPVHRTQIQENIRNELADGNGEFERDGALVVALGILRDRGSVRLLANLAKEKGDGKLRGVAVLALGLIGEPSAKEIVRNMLKEKDRTVRVDAAVAAGLLQDAGAVDGLVAVLQDPRSSQFALGSAAMALGQIGDARAVAPLRKIIGNEGSTFESLTRALSVVALGQMGDRSDLPVLVRVSRDVNYRANFDAIAELLTIL